MKKRILCANHSGAQLYVFCYRSGGWDCGSQSVDRMVRTRGCLCCCPLPPQRLPQTLCRLRWEGNQSAHAAAACPIQLSRQTGDTSVLSCPPLFKATSFLFQGNLSQRQVAFLVLFYSFAYPFFHLMCI